MVRVLPRVFLVCLTVISLAANSWGGILTRLPNSTLTLPREPVFGGYSLVNRFDTLRFTNPVALAFPPASTNELFVVERGGRIFAITNLAAPDKTLFLDLSSRVDSWYLEAGLLGMAFHPGYATNGYVYVLGMTWVGNDLFQRLARYQADLNTPGRAIPESELVLIDQPENSLLHNGGDLQFGPDGYLYVSWGDNGPDWALAANKQALDQDFGSGILRIDVDKRPGNLPPSPGRGASTNYFVPADNPFIGMVEYQGFPVNPQTLRTELYAIGLRNPWRIGFDPVTGDLFCGDVGEGLVEEINVIQKGGNYGWPYLEGDYLANQWEHTPTQFVSIGPILLYPHGTGTNEGRAVIGGVVYRGTGIPDLAGHYVFGDNLIGNIWNLRYDGTTNRYRMQWLASETGVSAFGIDPSNGDVLVVNHQNGSIKRLVYLPPEQATVFPKKLSATGAFSDLATLTVESGIVPYTLNAPFWSDNAIKRRWFALPGLSAKMEFHPSEPWNFPSGTVWIKHFEMEMTNGIASSRKRLETRFLVKTSTGGYG